MADDDLGLDQKQVQRQLENPMDDDNIGKALSELIEKVGDDNVYKMFSETTMEEIRHLSVEMTVGDDITEEFAKHYLLLKIAHNREGRRELLSIADALGNVNQQQEEQKMREKIRGMI